MFQTIDGKEYISTVAAAKQFGYTSDYVSKLAREDKVQGRKIGNAWFVEEESLLSFIEKTKKDEVERRRELKRKRQLEYQNGSRENQKEKTQQTSPYTNHVTFGTQVARLFAAAVGVAVFVVMFTVTSAVMTLQPIENSISFFENIIPSNNFVVTSNEELSQKKFVPVFDTFSLITNSQRASAVEADVEHLITGVVREKDVKTSLSWNIMHFNYDRFTDTLAYIWLERNAIGVELIHDGRTSATAVLGGGELLYKVSSNLFDFYTRLIDQTGSLFSYVVLNAGDLKNSLRSLATTFVDEGKSTFAFLDSESSVFKEYLIDYTLIGYQYAVESALANALFAYDALNASIKTTTKPFFDYFFWFNLAEDTAPEPSQDSFSPETVSSVPDREESAPGVTTIVREPTTVIQNITEAITYTGVSEEVFLTRLQELENSLRSDIYTFTSRYEGRTAGNYRAISLTNKIDQLSGVDITGGTITDAIISGGSISGVTLPTGSLTGVLSVVSGGTGTSTTPSYGQLLLGNAVGGYDLVATSSLGIGSGEAFTLTTNTFSESALAPTTTQNLAINGTGTSTFAGGVEAWRQIAAPYFHATSTTATSTFDGGLVVDATTFVIDSANNKIGIGTAAPTTGFDINVNTDISGDLAISGGSALSISATGPINQTGTGQVTFAGNVDATNGLDVTTGNFTVGGSNFSVIPATGNTTIGGALNLDSALWASSTAQVTGASRFYSTLQTDGTLTAAGSGTGLSVTNNATIGGTLGLTGAATFGSSLAVTGTLSAAATTLSGELALGSNKITGLANPTADTDAANKTYVDSVAQGLDLKDSVKAGTTANITLSGEQTIDGVSLSAGDRVLVKDQSDATKNGIYVVAGGSWSRSADADSDSEVTSGLFAFVESGTINGDSGWVITTSDPITVGVTSIAFTQFSGAGQITAGTGLTKSGNTFDVIGTADRITANADSIDIASTYVGQSSLTTVGTLNSGSITSGFGAIDIGSSALTAGAATFSSIIGSSISGSGDLTVSGIGAFLDNVTIDGTLSAATTTFTGDVALNGKKITGLADPTAAQEAATKAYVDAVAQGLSVKESVRVGTTANITLSGTQTIDGVSVIAGDRVLVKDQSTASENGIYTVAAGSWSRSTDADENSEVVSGMFAFVEEGTAQANTGWSLITANPITLDTTSLIFTQFSGSSDIAAGTGLTKSGLTVNVIGTTDRITANADSIDIASTYVGQSSLTTVGALNSGSITSGFGAIDIGSSALSAGEVTFATTTSFGDLAVGRTATTTIQGDNATSTFSGGISLATGNINLATGGSFLINNVQTLSATALGSSVVGSSLTSVGALDSGSLTTGFGAINIGADTLDAGTTTITNLVVQNSSTSTFAGGLDVLTINQTGTATSTFNNGIDLANGCFSVNGTCVGGGGGTIGSGTQGQFPFYNAAGNDLTATSTLFLTQAGNVGIGTTSPAWRLEVLQNGNLPGINIGEESTTNRRASLGFGLNEALNSGWIIGQSVPNDTTKDFYFYDASSAAYRLIIDDSGSVGIGDTSPSALLNVGSGNASTVDGTNDLFVTDDIEADGALYVAGAATVATLDTGQGANELYDMNQNVLTTSAVTFATLNTGQGAYELYAMNQNVRTTDSPTFVDLNSIQDINGDFGTSMVRSVDEWLRLNHGNTHTNGVYIGNNLRVDGAIGINQTADSNTVFTITANTNQLAAYWIGNHNDGFIGGGENNNTGGNSDGWYIKTGPNTNPGTSNDYIMFADGNYSNIGSIDGNGSGGVRYNTTSDIRIKENIVDTAFTLDDLLKIQVRDYNPLESDKLVTGFVAQELWEVLPLEDVISQGDILEDGTEDFWTVDYGRLTPYIVKSVQDLAGWTGELDINLNSIATSSDAVLEEGSFASQFFTNLFARITDWLASTANGIGDLFANRIRTQELCVSDASGSETCVTKSQLDSLIAGVALANAPSINEEQNNNEEQTPTTPLVEIIVNHNNPALVEVGSDYSDLGALASTTDASIQALGVRTFFEGSEVTTVTIDTSIDGTHTVIYRIIDAEGVMLAEASREVIVGTGVVEPIEEPAQEEPTEPEPTSDEGETTDETEPAEGESQEKNTPLEEPTQETGGGEGPATTGTPVEDDSTEPGAEEESTPQETN